MTPSVLKKLGLPPRATLFRNAPAGCDGAAIIAALKAAIADLGPVLGLNLKQDLRPGQVLRVVATAAKALLGDPNRLREAVFLTEQAAADQTDSAALAHIRILALAQLGNRPRLIAEVDRLLALQPPDARLQEILHGFVNNRNLRNEIARRAENHAWLWGEIPQDLALYIKSLQPDEKTAAMAPKVADFIYDRRGDSTLSRADFTRRMLWGNAAGAYFRFIQGCVVDIHTRQARGQVLPVEAEKLLALRGQFDSVILPPDPAPLEQTRDAGRSIVIVEAHVGTSILSQLGLARLGLPSTLIANGVPISADPAIFNISSSGKDVQTQFLKLVKLIRKQQRLVRLFPDGAVGDLLAFDLFGRRIMLGQGAATLAYHGHAATFFVRSQWNGTRFQLQFLPGPIAEAGMARAAFDAAFYDFYLGCLRQIVRGAPEDMCLKGGFWRFFH